MVVMVGCIYNHFRRWPNNYIYQKRNSRKACISGNLPRFSKPQYLNKQSDSAMVKKKIGKFQERRYISRGQVRSLNYFQFS